MYEITSVNVLAAQQAIVTIWFSCVTYRIVCVLPSQVWLFQHALHRLPHQRGGHFYDGGRPLLVPRHHGITAPRAHGVPVVGESGS